ncbi:hypothetical protein HOY82DRAFT_604989 [Tuber indicum]|nr:hypothetical protein HOY82DRAFT_604989 [Tuber indicum]
MCTLTGSIDRWVAPKSLGKQEFRDARVSGWDDLWPLRDISPKAEHKIGDEIERLGSELMVIKDPHGDEKETEEVKKVARLQRKLHARDRHAKVVGQHKEKERKLQGKAMTEKETREMHKEKARIHRGMEGNRGRCK